MYRFGKEERMKTIFKILTVFFLVFIMVLNSIIFFGTLAIIGIPTNQIIPFILCFIMYAFTWFLFVWLINQLFKEKPNDR